MSSIKTAFKGLLGSKKAMMAFISSGVWVAGKFGLQWSAAELLPVVGPLWGYIAAQCGADWGKSKAEIEAGGKEAAAVAVATADSTGE